MKQKQRLLVILIAFPIVFFCLLVFMSWRVEPASAVTDIRTVESVPAAARQAAEPAKPDLGMPDTDRFAAEEAVRKFFRAGGRVVVVVAHPTSRYLDIQLPYLLRMQRPYGSDEPLDRSRLVSEVQILISDGDDTKGRELWELCLRYAGFLRNVYTKNHKDKTACSIMGELNEPNTIYVRLSAALVYIHEDAVFSMVSHKLRHPETLLVSGNVVNNREIAFMHEARGVFEPGAVWNEIRYEEGNLLEEMGLDRGLARRELPELPFKAPRGRDLSAPQAYQQQLFFLKALRQQSSRLHANSLDKFRFDVMDFQALEFDVWTPDVYAFSGADVLYDFNLEDCERFPSYALAHPEDRFAGISKLDHYLTSVQGMGKKGNKYSVAVGGALAVVLITHSQHLLFHTNPPFEPYPVEPRGAEGYEMDGTSFMDPYFDAAMRILAEQMVDMLDDDTENIPSDPVQREGDDGVPLAVDPDTAARLAGMTARDLPDYVAGDPDQLMAELRARDALLPQEQGRDRELLDWARQHIARGRHYGVECQPGSEGVASKNGRFSGFGCYGWLEDRLLGRYQALSDKLFAKAADQFQPTPR